MLVADALNELQKADLTTSLREIYYRTKHTMGDSHENTFDDQAESDPVIEDLEVGLAALREEFHVRAENAGTIIGPVIFEDDGDTVNCAKLGKGGYSCLPSSRKSTCRSRSAPPTSCSSSRRARSGTASPRTSSGASTTASSSPATASPARVRRLARRLHEEKKLPVYVLVDNDPWGYYIYSVVKQGSINLAFESQRMAIPQRSSSACPPRPRALRLPRNVGIKLNDKDISRAKELMAYPWFQKKEWQVEIKRMLTSGLKFELDALANKDFQYLTKQYLPRKLKDKDWLD